MDNDCIVQTIVEKLSNDEDVLVSAVKQYRKVILAKYTSVKDLLSRCNGRPKHARTLTLLYKYISDNE